MFLTRVERSIEIKVPPEKVWPLHFWDRVPEWNDWVKEVRSTSKKRGVVGATYHVVAEGREYDVEITEIVEYERCAWRSTSGWTASGVTILERTDAGTKMTLRMDYTLPGIVDRLFARRAIEKNTEKALEKLKTILEK